MCLQYKQQPEQLLTGFYPLASEPFDLVYQLCSFEVGIELSGIPAFTR